MRVLLVASKIESPPRFGGEIRKWNILAALKECAELDLVMFQPPDASVSSQISDGCRRCLSMPIHWLQPTERHNALYQSTLGRLALTFGSLRPFQYLGPPRDELQAWFRALVQENEYDVIWICGAPLAVALGWHDRSRTILDGCDFEFVIEYLLLRNSPWYGAKVCDYLNVVKLALWERRLHRWFARVARCSEADRNVVKARNVVVVPNGTYMPEGPTTRQPDSSVLFVGDLKYAPNAAGMDWFLHEVWPHVHREVPKFVVDIVGRLSPESARRWEGIPGVRIHGFVPDLGPHLEKATVSIVPLLAGGGTRLKILEALSHAVPVVSTSVGAFGLDLTAVDGVYRADGRNEFGAALIEILKDGVPAQKAAWHGRGTVQRLYNWEGIRLQIADLTREVAGAGVSAIPSLSGADAKSLS